MSSTLQILADFRKSAGKSVDEATRAELRILLGATNVTEYADIDDRRDVSDRLDIPTYYLAEWLAENWWPLMCEPRKSEDSEEDDPDFLSRHSFLTAQQGYALPGIKVVSNGRRAIYVNAFARNAPHADVRFLRTASLNLSPEAVSSQFRDFIRQTIDSLDRFGFHKTELHDAWRLVENTAPEEEAYCKMIGALGLNPYADIAIDSVLFDLVDRSSERLAMDLCLTARPEEFSQASIKALQAYDAASAAIESDLEPLLSVQVAPDNLMTPAWKRGVMSADRLREKLGISDLDPKGGTAFLDALGIGSVSHSTRLESEELVRSDQGMQIVGAVIREDDKAKFGLLQATGRGRRFAAARGAFMAWISENDESRLLTQAVTRDQQSSRGFAAEILAPIAFLRSQATKRHLFKDQIDDLADELGVSAGLVWKQAQNNGLEVSYH